MWEILQKAVQNTDTLTAILMNAFIELLCIFHPHCYNIHTLPLFGSCVFGASATADVTATLAVGIVASFT